MRNHKWIKRRLRMRCVKEGQGVEKKKKGTEKQRKQKKKKRHSGRRSLKGNQGKKEESIELKTDAKGPGEQKRCNLWRNIGNSIINI